MNTYPKTLNDRFFKMKTPELTDIICFFSLDSSTGMETLVDVISYQTFKNYDKAKSEVISTKLNQSGEVVTYTLKFDPKINSHAVSTLERWQESLHSR